MKRFTLSETQQEKLRSNPNIKSVPKAMVQFTANFKRHVLKEYTRGVHLRDIFTSANIPLEWFGKEYERGKYREWKKIANTHGLKRFDEEYRGQRGVNLERWRDKTRRYAHMTKDEKIVYLQTENEALEYVRRHFQLPPSIRNR